MLAAPMNIKWENSVYDFAVQGGSVGTIVLPAGALVSPNSIVYYALANTTTDLVGVGASVGFELSGGGTLITTQVIANYNGPVKLNSTPGLLATVVAGENISIVIAGADLTAGVVIICLGILEFNN